MLSSVCTRQCAFFSVLSSVCTQNSACLPCPQDFYSSSQAYTLIRGVRKWPDAELEHRPELVPLAMTVWHDVLTATKENIIDFLLL